MIERRPRDQDPARLGELTWLQLAGHPTAQELARGRRLRLAEDGTEIEGGPVSVWQVACDRQCASLAQQYRVRHGIVREPAPPLVFEAAPTESEGPESGPFGRLAGYRAVRP